MHAIDAIGKVSFLRLMRRHQLRYPKGVCVCVCVCVRGECVEIKKRRVKTKRSACAQAALSILSTN